MHTRLADEELVEVTHIQWKLIIPLLFALIGCICFLGYQTDQSDAANETFASGNFTYEITSNDSVKVKGYSSGTVSNVDIPETVTYAAKTYKVTAIGKLGSSSMTSLTIPQYVLDIDEKAFFGSKYLTTINFNATNLHNGVSSSYWFANGSFMADYPDARTIYFGDGVKTIPAYLSSGTATRIQFVHIPSSVTSIGQNAFSNGGITTHVYFYGMPSSFGSACFASGSKGMSWNTYGEIYVHSMYSTEFLNSYGNQYTRFHYEELPHVQLDMSGKTPSPVPPGWTIYNGKLVKYFAEGDTITIPNIHVTGYTFMGWNNSPATIMGNTTLSYTSSWEINHVTLTFETGEGTPISPIYQNYGTSISISNPSRTGYNFIGWSPTLPSTVPEYDQLYTAQWQLQSHTVSYNVDGGDPISSTVINYGATIPLPTPQKEGHSFVNWTLSPAGNTMGEQDVVATAHWSINTYTLKFNTGEGTPIEDISAVYGTPISINNPTRTGYMFDHWSPSLPSTVPGQNQTYTAIWTIQSHTVTYNTNGGTYIPPVNITYGTTIPTPNVNKEGHSFAGWTFYPNVQKMGESDVTVTAHWTINTYTLHFDTNGGTAVENIVANYGTPISVVNPHKDNYVFDGWSPELPSSVPATNQTYVAQWIKEHHSVTYVLSGGEPIPSCEVDTGDTIPLPDPQYTGYDFLGWTLIPSGSIMGHSDVVATANWSIRSVTLHFDSNGGDPVLDIVQNYDTVVNVPFAHRTGYTFLGWSPEVPAYMPEVGQTFTAQWEIQSHVVTYISNGGPSVDSVDIEYGQTIPLPNISRNNYDFGGWSLSPASSTMGESNVIATAIWNPVAVTLTFNSNGGTAIATIHGHYGEPLHVPTPTRVGYNFSGWYPTLPSTMPGTDKAYSAQWKVIMLTVSYETGGGSKVNSQQVAYDSYLPLPSKDPTRDGYKFIKWSMNSNMRVTHNLTVTAEWEAKYYRIYYNDTYGIPEFLQDYQCGEPISKVKPPTLEGYEFKGWKEDISTMPANDLYLTPIWLPVEEKSNTSISTFAIAGGAIVAIVLLGGAIAFTRLRH